MLVLTIIAMIRIKELVKILSPYFFKDELMSSEHLILELTSSFPKFLPNTLKHLIRHFKELKGSSKPRLSLFRTYIVCYISDAAFDVVALF